MFHRFWTVGHGGFYTEAVCIPGFQEIFDYVYDCGTKEKKSRIQRFVNKYVDELIARNKYTLDLIVISHIDDDHINQLDYLLRRLAVRNVKLKYFVMPYLTDLSKTFLRKRYKGIGKWFRDFIDDPESYVRNASNSEAQLKLIYRGKEPAEISPIDVEGFGFDERNARFVGMRNRTPVWALSFFQKGLEDTLINDFDTRMVKRYGKVSVRTIIEAERDHNFIDLRDIYKRSLKKTNDTSVCLKSHYLDSDAAIVLTGDCPVGECWSEFSNFFKLNALTHLHLYQLAHHGSTSAWKTKSSDKSITHDLQADLPACWFVAHSKKNNRHVSKKVMDEFFKRGRIVNELIGAMAYDYFP